MIRFVVFFFLLAGVQQTYANANQAGKFDCYSSVTLTTRRPPTEYGEKTTPIQTGGFLKLISTDIRKYESEPFRIQSGDKIWFYTTVKLQILRSEMKISAEVIRPQGDGLEVLARGESLFQKAPTGLYNGELVLASSEVATLAKKLGISYRKAKGSDALPIGVNFTGLAVHCFERDGNGRMPESL